MSEPTLRSPQEFYDIACEEMLDGFDPITSEDWAKIVNYWAFNIHPEVAYDAISLMLTIFNGSEDLTDERVKEIIDFQLEKQKERSA